MNRILGAALLGASLIVAAPAFAQDEAAAPAADAGLVRADDRALGDADAPLVMIEYASVACPHCAQWHQENWPMVSDEFISTGQIRFVMREMLTGEPRLAMAGFMTARCAADELYFDAIHLLFEEQRAIFEAAQGGAPRDIYLEIAAALGMNEEEFDACLENQEVLAGVIAAHEQAVADGVNGTPTFIFNGTIVASGHAPDHSGHIWMADGEPLLIDGETVPTNGGADSFRRIILHFLNQAGE